VPHGEGGAARLNARPLPCTLAFTARAAMCAIWQTVKTAGVAVRIPGVAWAPARGVPAHPWDVSRDPSHGISDPSHGISDPWALSERKLGSIFAI